MSKIEFSSDVLYYAYLFPKGMENLENKIVQSDQKLLLLSSTFALPKEKIDKSVIDLLRMANILMFDFGDKYITQEILLLSFTKLNDQTRYMLNKNNINLIFYLKGTK